ncbi:MAG: transcriptional regulator [Oscillospiraceae bacterium]|nr:transcriptional regulator [Oscillospiraceae bacterium]
MNFNLKDIQLLCDSIANQFGPSCEVVFHDLTQDYDHTIVAIANGHITNRTVGGPGTNAGLKALKELSPDSNSSTYMTHTKDGRTLKTTSAYFRDEQGNIVSSLCINLDISDMLCMRNMLDAQLNIGKEENECFSNDISDVLESIINDTISHIGKPGFRMSRREKIEAIRYLDSHGAFLVKRSVERVCAALDVSRNSFYAYLDDARKNSDS